MSDGVPQLILKAGRDRSLRHGHPWVFSGAVASVCPPARAGDVVLAVSGDGRPLGLGFYQPQTDIIFRLLTGRTDEPVDGAFWRRRIRQAMDLRSQVVPPETTAYRLVHAEGDGLPGLIVDRYGRVLVVSFATAGMDRKREEIVSALVDEIKPDCVLERSEGRARRLEGLQDRQGILFGDVPPGPVEVLERGLRYRVDVLKGQKTGFFLDQRENRALLGSLSAGASVFNGFAFTGGFSVACGRGGAKRVVSVDVSEDACALARENLAANGLSPEDHPVVRADVFQYLRETEETFDLVILDPPAFAKTRRDVTRAARGYKDANLQALLRLREGGILATFSCSNAVDEVLFERIVQGALQDAGRAASVLFRVGAGPDHPVSLAHPEGRYLKGLVLAVHGASPGGPAGPAGGRPPAGRQ
ncbi:MAG TPA: class I SAM-dependent rRNA methyltransferase [Syntrophales bacterium]|nr:class I SAM-dependent rRNA methyltransferase [Syntrophales bacterium]